MGRTPPLSLLNAISRAPKKKGRTASGTRPSNTSVQNALRADKRGANQGSEGSEESISIKCWGCRPSGPADDPTGKDKMAAATSPSVT